MDNVPTCSVLVQLAVSILYFSIIRINRFSCLWRMSQTPDQGHRGGNATVFPYRAGAVRTFAGQFENAMTGVPRVCRKQFFLIRTNRQQQRPTSSHNGLQIVQSGLYRHYIYGLKRSLNSKGTFVSQKLCLLRNELSKHTIQLILWTRKEKFVKIITVHINKCINNIRN